MSRRWFQILAASAAVLSLATALPACGGSDSSQDELDQAREEGAKEAQQQARIKDIEKQVRNLKKSKNGSSPGSLPSNPGGSTASSGGTTTCGGSLSVGPNTTCGFAANVEADYYAEIGAGSGSVYSYSPTTGRYYTMYCSAGSPHVCTGGNDASVYFP
jgi:hypothetical protein